MDFIDVIVILIIALIVGGATAYIVKAKKSGQRCIGCPDGGSCHAKKNNTSPCCSSGDNSSGCSGCSGACHCHAETDESKNA